MLELLHGVSQSSDPNAEVGQGWRLSAKLSVRLPHRWALEVVSDLSRYDVTPAGQMPYAPTVGFSGKVIGVTPL
jgi:hypothetical protein